MLTCLRHHTCTCMHLNVACLAYMYVQYILVHSVIFTCTWYSIGIYVVHVYYLPSIYSSLCLCSQFRLDIATSVSSPLPSLPPPVIRWLAFDSAPTRRESSQ